MKQPPCKVAKYLGQLMKVVESQGHFVPYVADPPPKRPPAPPPPPAPTASVPAGIAAGVGGAV
eukprot:2545081-Lingulodinium_polyedra.AAC.1